MKYTNKSVKQAGIFLLAVGLLVACQTAENKEVETHTEQATGTNAHHENESASGLSLNNGAKWKADVSTNKNVSELYNVIADANPVNVEDYQKTGKALQTGIDKMISECRMQGADHDALHHWLEPLMKGNKKLTETTTVEEGKKLFGMVRQQIENYSDYFE